MNTLNTYLVPIDIERDNNFNHFLSVFAYTEQSAYLKARDWAYMNFKDCNSVESVMHYKNEPYSKLPGISLSTKYEIFSIEDKNDIIKENFYIEEDIDMRHFQINWNDYTQELCEKADKEAWTNDTYPNNGILTNYLVHTYKRLRTEKQITINKEKEYGLFNTGLFTKYYEPIYAYSNSEYKISFLTGHELNQHGILDRPSKANYFEDPSLLLFDWHYPIDIHFKHILEDERNKERLPKGFLDKPNKMCILTGAIELMKRKVSSNYKLAIPQYYEDKIQLLLPLCLDTDKGKPDLALAVTKLDNCYQGYTCLTLDMAYNNARLIAKPESNWLTN